MIRYKKSYWGFLVLSRMYGSAFPRALPFSLASAAVAGLLAGFFPTSTTWELFNHPYPFQTFAFVAGFMVVFRSNLSYGRYWEGRTQLQQMSSKLTDAVVMALNFDRTAVPRIGATQDQLSQHKWFCDTFVHLISLLHAVALCTLRDDFDMENLVAHDSFAQAPRANIRCADLEIMNDMSEPTSGDSAAMGASDSDNAGPSSADAGKGTGLVRHRGKPEGPLGEPPKGPPDLNSMHAQSLAGKRSFLDYFILRTDPAHAQHIYRAMKLPVIGGFTQAEGVALGAFVTSGDKCTAVPSLDLGIHGVILGNGCYAPAPTERVHTILAWIQQVLIERIHDGGVKAAPPIQSRIHQVLSDSMLGYEQCKKLNDTPFPFPWAQAVNIVLMLFCAALPFVVVAFTKHFFVAAAITFIAAHTHVMLNEVARDIEDPFLYDPNELPLPQMQYKLNERLLAVSRSERPVAFTDVGDLSGPGNTIQMPVSQPDQASTPSPSTIQTGAMSSPAAAGAAVPPPSSSPSPAVPGAPSAPGHTANTDSAVNPISSNISSAAQPAKNPPSSPMASSIQASAAHASPAGSPSGTASAAATSGEFATMQLEPQVSDRPIAVDSSDLRAYSTANVPQDVVKASNALRWRAVRRMVSKGRNTKSLMRRSTQGHLRSGAGDGEGPPSPSPVQDMEAVYSTPLLRDAVGPQRALSGHQVSRSRWGRGRPSNIETSKDSTPGMAAAAAGDAEGLQVVVAVGDEVRQREGAVHSTAGEAMKAEDRGVDSADAGMSHLSQSITFRQGARAVVAAPQGEEGLDAVSAEGVDSVPVQCRPGGTPFALPGEETSASGESAMPRSTREHSTQQSSARADTAE